jgi:hypothetical protein
MPINANLLAQAVQAAIAVVNPPVRAAQVVRAAQAAQAVPAVHLSMDLLHLLNMDQVIINMRNCLASMNLLLAPVLARVPATFTILGSKRFSCYPLECSK